MQEDLTKQQNLTRKERRVLKRQEKEEEKARTRRQQLIKRVAAWTFVALAFGGAVFGAVKFRKNSAGEAGVVLLTDKVAESDQVEGKRDAKIILVEYGDFQCPACGSYFPVVKRLHEEFGDDLLFVYRHFPLKNIHKNAELAARAAEAAGKQGKFWEMHDMIFENQSRWSGQEERDGRETFLSYAKSLGLNSGQFKTDMDSQETEEKIARDFESGIRSGVNSTPTFFLNGGKIENPQGYDAFKDVLKKR